MPEPLPPVLRGLLEEWDLERETDEVWGRFSVAVPVRTGDGGSAVLKVADPGIETEHEALALQTWGGRGAVRLLRADPHRRAVLLERLERRDLTEEWDVAACEVVGDLYGRLHVPAPPRFSPLRAYVERNLEPLAALPRDAGLPHRMVQQCVGLLRDLTTDPASTGVLVHGDLHYENVLARAGDGEGDVAGDRVGGWVAIDPHAMSGDPHWEPAPLLWTRFDEVAGDVRRALRARFHAVVDAAGLDEDRARAWATVRLVLNAFWAVRDGEPDPAYVTRMLTVAKAIAD
ncbi:streptomycin 6-kinase [Nocardioides ginkgobilobae]